MNNSFCEYHKEVQFTYSNHTKISDRLSIEWCETDYVIREDRRKSVSYTHLNNRFVHFSRTLTISYDHNFLRILMQCNHRLSNNIIQTYKSLAYHEALFKNSFVLDTKNCIYSNNIYLH